MAAKSPPPAPEPITLKCGECAFENEKQRVFCHNCGAKLDRSILPKGGSAILNPSGISEHTKKRVEKLMDPNRYWWKRDIQSGFKVLGFSLLAAILLLIIRKPGDIPTALADNALPEQDLKMVWSDAVNSSIPTTAVVNEETVNHFLRRMVKPRPTIVPGVELKAMSARLQPDVLQLFVERSLFGMPFYTTVSYRVEVKQGKIVPKVVSSHLGQLAVHPVAGPLMNYALADVWPIFKNESKQFNRLQKVVFAKEKLAFSTEVVQ